MWANELMKYARGTIPLLLVHSDTSDSMKCDFSAIKLGPILACSMTFKRNVAFVTRIMGTG